MPRAIRIWPVVVAGMALAACGGKKEAGTATEAPAPEEKAVSVLNWSDYIGETTIADFQAATGIKVTYDVFDSNEVLETKLLAGRSGYDIVVPTAPFLERQIKAGVFLKLDKSKLPNLSNMDPEIMQRVAAHDPGNAYSITYLWGTIGLGYNPDMVKKALGTDTIDSWSAILDPVNAAKLAKCGITMLDAPTDVFGSVAIYLGLDPNSEKPEDLKAVEIALMKVRPHIRYFHSSSYINDLAAGEICVALGWSGDVLQARDRGAAASKPVRDLVRDPEGRRDQLLRHAGDSGGRAASRQRARLPQLHDGPAGDREGHEQGALREREFRGAPVRRRGDQERSEHLSERRDPRAAAPGPVREPGLQPRAEPGLDANPQRPVARGSTRGRRVRAGGGRARRLRRREGNGR